MAHRSSLRHIYWSLIVLAGACQVAGAQGPGAAPAPAKPGRQEVIAELIAANRVLAKLNDLRQTGYMRQWDLWKRELLDQR